MDLKSINHQNDRIMPSPLKVTEQSIQRQKVDIKHIPGRGNGLFANRDIPVKSQIIFILTPLILALETPRLQDTCYQCLQSTEAAKGAVTSAGQSAAQLLTCTGCRVVKFCGKDCQTLAWSHYHKLECKLYAQLHPRILPSTVRAVIRLLKQHQAKILPEGEFQQLLGRESHQDDLAAAGGQRWQNLFLMVKAVKTYSGTDESIGIVLRICCILMLNSFTLTTSTFDPIGVVLHPFPALINHSCQPNAIVRFDVRPTSSGSSCLPRPISPTYGSISIHALRPVQKDDEITISYIDSTFPFFNRQKELKERYFFTCTCPLCLNGPNASAEQFLSPSTSNSATSVISPVPRIDSNTLSDIQATAEDTFRNVQSRPGTETSQIPHLKAALHSLAKTARFPLHHYPYPQLRQQLILALLTVQEFEEAIIHSAILVRLVDPDVFEPHHPIRMIHAWTFWRLCWYCAIEAGKAGRQDEARMWAILGGAVLKELVDLLAGPASWEGEFEKMIKAAHNSEETGWIWCEYKQEAKGDAERVWTPMDCRIQKALEEEAAQYFSK